MEASKNIPTIWHDKPKVMAIAAYVIEGDGCFDVGINDFMSKPIQIDVLRSKFIKWGTNSEKFKIYS